MKKEMMMIKKNKENRFSSSGEVKGDLKEVVENGR